MASRGCHRPLFVPFGWPLVGRASLRHAGRPPTLWLVEDLKEGPRPPEPLNLDKAALKKKFADVQRRSTLGKFHFGTSDYDRWAVVFGRIERRAGDDAKKAPANLVYRGSTLIFVITSSEW
jgi:hypothetical protein